MMDISEGGTGNGHKLHDRKKRCCCSAQCCWIAVLVLLVVFTALYFLLGAKLVELSALPRPIGHLGSPKPWKILHRQTKDQNGDGDRPSIRYGHTVTSHRGKMLVTHGYFFNAAQNWATWLSDTWAMDMASSQWSLLSPGISQAEAMRAYIKGKPAQPCGRFGHGTAVSGNTLYMYGGHDGGFSKTGRQNYDPGYDFDELWALDLANGSWSLMSTRPDPSLVSLPVSNTQGEGSGSSSSPGGRYLLASAVVEGALIIYGGNKEGQGDVWSLDLTKDEYTWCRLAPEVPRSRGGPGRRVGSALIPISFPGAPRGFLLHAGRNTGNLGGEPALLGDAWFFDLSSGKWRQLEMQGSAPNPRRYHGHTHTHLAIPSGLGAPAWGTGHSAAWAPVGVVVGGSVDSPSHVCSGDAWAFTLDCRVRRMTWIRLPDLPYAIYDMHAAAHKHEIFTFGGHLCRDSKKDLPFSYTNQVWKLDLAPHVLPHLTRDNACLMQDGGSANGPLHLRSAEL